MEDRCFFIQHDIGCQQIDDFLVLPNVPIYMGKADQRHFDCFAYTH